MITPLDSFYERQEAGTKECLLALKSIILSMDKDIVPAWKYSMPFFCYHEKMFCYLWTHKKYGLPYLGIVDGRHIEHMALISEKRSRMKIMLVDPRKDLPVKEIRNILQQAIALRRGTTL